MAEHIKLEIALLALGLMPLWIVLLSYLFNKLIKLIERIAYELGKDN